MVFDSEQQKMMLLQIIEATGFKGSDIESAYELKQAVRNGLIRLPNDSTSKDKE